MGNTRGTRSRQGRGRFSYEIRKKIIKTASGVTRFNVSKEKMKKVKIPLPPLPVQEEIVRIQVTWMEEFASKYPKMADNARSIHTSEDNAYNTSYETYLRGELGTYSETTFVLYGRFITELMQQGKNLAYETMTNTAKLYGYESVEDAEKRMW